MLNEQNYNELADFYAEIKRRVREENISQEQFVEHLEKQTEFGRFVLAFVNKTKDESESVDDLLEEVIRLVYHF